MEFNWWVGHLFGGLWNKFVLNVHSLKIWVVHQLVYIYIYIYIYIIQVIFTSEAKRVLYRKGADIPVDGQLNEGTSILIQICFIDQHGVGPLIS